jgi:hypothetical protein
MQRTEGVVPKQLRDKGRRRAGSFGKLAASLKFGSSEHGLQFYHGRLLDSFAVAAFY